MFSAATKSKQVSSAANYIEDTFAVYLYTGNDSTQTINNGIDLAGKGGLVWTKTRNVAQSHQLVDTVRGQASTLSSNSTNAADINSGASSVSSFSSTGYVAGVDFSDSTRTYVSWTFRKQPKFFDVVTYTGDDSNPRSINHNLGSVPAVIIIKCTSASATSWQVYHRSLGDNGTYQYNLYLDDFSAKDMGYAFYKTSDQTSTTFKIGTGNGINNNGATYVAYLFAHDAGGFGLTGTDNVISCGAYAGTGSTTGFNVDLGYEPQWVLVKRATGGTGNWGIVDNMRGFAVTAPNRGLSPNSASAEYSLNSTYPIIQPTATGFRIQDTINADWNASGSDYIYIAIRRGPMKVPTDATKVFGLNARSGTGANATVTGGQVDDAVLIKNRGSAVGDLFASRLTGTGYLVTSSTAAEVAAGTTILQANPWDVMDGVKVGTTSTITNASSNTFINYLFQRAPGFFDEVCYTGTGSATTQAHNLGVAPELVIVKSRNNGSYEWRVLSTALSKVSKLNGTTAFSTTNLALYFGDGTSYIAPTASNLYIGTAGDTNANTVTYVAYLFATVTGVSKVGSYTGNGSNQTINCGFTGGSRFVLIKRTDSTGNWTVFDSARGIVAGNDPALFLNNTDAEVTTIDAVDTDNSGFIVNQDTTLNLNVNSASYIFLAIA